MTGAAEEFHRAVREFPVRPLRTPVYSAVGGRAYTPGDDLLRGLADCLVRPARLPDILVRGVRPPALVLEAGTGLAASRNVRRTLRDAHALALSPLREPADFWDGAPATVPLTPLAQRAGALPRHKDFP